ncbi:MAG: glycoside hydrolase family 5 protein [Brevinematales bacterium]
MDSGFIQVKSGEFIIDNKPIILRGFVLGSWMNMEAFMMGIIVTDKRIRQTFTDVYGSENAAQFFDDYLRFYISEEDFILLKSLGINVLRLALDYRHFEDDQTPGKYTPDCFKHIDRVIELCRKYNIFAILDMHSSPGGQNPDSHGGGETGVSSFWKDALSRERIIKLWGYIAEKYKNEPVIAGFDILNEPAFVSDIDAFNDFFEGVIRKIREIDNNHIIFLEGDDWAKEFGIFKNLGGDQQAISFHFYPAQHVYMSGEPGKRKAELENKLSYFLGLREKTGMPLWVGETGGYFSRGMLLEGLALIKECIDLFEKYGISWTYWSYKDTGAMGLVYPKNDTKWMAWTRKIRDQKRGLTKTNITGEIFKILEEKFSYNIDDQLKEKLKFRIYSFLDEIHVHQIIKPELESVSWEEIKDYGRTGQPD